LFWILFSIHTFKTLNGLYPGEPFFKRCITADNSNPQVQTKISRENSPLLERHNFNRADHVNYCNYSSKGVY